MGFFKRKKKDTDLNIELSEGLFLGRPGSVERQNSLFSCFPKGILCFLVVFGSLGGFISAYDMECNYVVPGIVLFLAAMYFSGLFAFRKSYHKDFGYIAFFLFYVFAIYLLKSYVNSGFSAIVNVIKQEGEVYFNLNTGTEFAEKIDDRYMTISITFIFIGIFQIILLNIFLSNYMSLKLAVFMGLSLYAVPLYFQKEPGEFFVLCMICGFIGIYIFKNCGHFKDGESRQRYEQVSGKKILRISYTQDNKVARGILLAAACCTLVLAVFSVFYNEFDFRKSYRENSYKEATREGVSGFLMLGFRSFYRNAYMRGGMSGGYLGNITAVRPDNETDLVVRFAPYSNAPVYLKGYTGIFYGTNQWSDAYQTMGTELGKSDFFLYESMADEAGLFEGLHKAHPEKQGKGVIEIENKGANTHYVYYPYFTRFDDYGKYTDNKSGIFVGSPLGQTNRFTFYPGGQNMVSQTGKSEEIMSESVALDVPDKNLASVERFIREAGISGMPEKALSVSRAEWQKIRSAYEVNPAVIDQVVSYMKKEYTYSYNPGRLPSNTDFINYFLDENKKGVCSHFASAATLIFRRLGIPARYVEGYAFGYDAIRGGKLREDLKYEDYYQGFSELGKTAVVEVEVTDANAHAWVEVYLAGRGWTVVDPTPAAITDDSDSAGGFWSSLVSFWNDSSDLKLSGDWSGLNLSFLSSERVRVALTVLVLLAALAGFVWVVVKRLLHWRRWHTKDLHKNMAFYYRELCRKRGRRDAEFARLTVPAEQLAYLAGAQAEGEDWADGRSDVLGLVSDLERICFSPEEPEREEYEQVRKTLRRWFAGKVPITSEKS